MFSHYTKSNDFTRLLSVGSESDSSRKRLHAKNTSDLHLTYSNKRGSVGWK